jgi:hypothetical protein
VYNSCLKSEIKLEVYSFHLSQEEVHTILIEGLEVSDTDNSSPETGPASCASSTNDNIIIAARHKWNQKRRENGETNFSLITALDFHSSIKY